MSFNLDPAMPMSEAVRRAACGEIDAAHTALASPPELHRGVHDARKCLKRIRSLLVLIRPGLPEPLYLSLNERVRAIAKGLAPARDAQALLDAIDKIGGNPEAQGDSSPIRALRAWLHRRRQAAERSLEASTASTAMQGLVALRPSLSTLAVYPDNFTPVAEGLRASYRGGRRAFANAFETGSDEAFHDWRKSLQHHWRHMQLLAPCWPSELSARAELARNLSQILGEDHDISLIVQLVSAPTMVFASPEDTAAFLKRCRAKHKALRREAKARGARLFVERPRPFVERIEAYWRTDAEIAVKGPPLARNDNVIAFGDANAASRARAG